MNTHISDNDLEDIDFFVPGWFSKAALAGEKEEALREKIKKELAAAHEMADRKISPFELKEKADDLYDVYMEALREDRARGGDHGAI